MRQRTNYSLPSLALWPPRLASSQGATPATSSSQPPTHLAIPWRHAAILSATTLNPLLMAPLFLLLLLLLAQLASTQQSHPSAHTPVYGHLFIMPTESRSNIFIIISSCCHFGEHHRFVHYTPKKEAHSAMIICHLRATTFIIISVGDVRICHP